MQLSVCIAFQTTTNQQHHPRELLESACGAGPVGCVYAAEEPAELSVAQTL